MNGIVMNPELFKMVLGSPLSKLDIASFVLCLPINPLEPFYTDNYTKLASV